MNNENINTYRIHMKNGNKELEVEGDKEFVEKTFLNLYAQMPEITNSLALEQDSIIFDGENHAIFISDGHHTPIKKDVNGNHPEQRISLAGYLLKTSAESDSDKTLAIAAYLYEHKGYSEFTKTEIEQGRREAILKKSTNVSRDINGNRKKGYFDVSGEKDGLMSFYITQEGLEAVKKMTIK